jgi:hypothetical protein
MISSSSLCLVCAQDELEEWQIQHKAVFDLLNATLAHHVHRATDATHWRAAPAGTRRGHAVVGMGTGTEDTRRERRRGGAVF